MFDLRLIVSFFFVLAALFHAEVPCIASDLGDVLRGARDLNRTTRETKALYKDVQSIIVPVVTQRQDKLATDKDRVVFYSASWCGYCKQARSFMRSRQVAFVEYDIETSPQGYADYRALNGTGVPILLVGDQRLNGWEASRFDQMYRQFKSSQAQAAAGATSSQSMGGSGGAVRSLFEAGVVVAAKIANVPIYSSSAQDSIAARLTKGEEVVVLQSTEGDLAKVQSAAAVGYVDRRMVRPVSR